MLFVSSINSASICFLSFLIVALCLCVFMLLMSFLLGGYSVFSYSRNVPFESGINSIGTARLRFSIHFYLIGVIFVIFDAEALYIYIWSIIIRESSWYGLIEIVIFVFFLLLGLIYLMVMDVFNWKKDIFHMIE